MARLHVEPRTGVVTKRLSQLEFSTRVGFEHEAALDQLQDDPNCPRSVASQIRTMIRWMSRPEEQSGVNVLDLRTQALADFALGVLSNQSLMTIVGRTAYTTAETAALRATWLDPEGSEPIDTFVPTKVIG